ncbi:uncharacterized protein LOC143533326 [Bidens hawaiensis]|uniref:uncharacterized protein LOC143533326 n=1 Tax=Bidens hawaiensis TaxID=980011 RepID=UPI004049984F
MRKLYNHNKGKIHPSPPPTTTNTDHLSLLPLAIATLAASLSPGDKEVLAYLLSCSLTTTTNNNNTTGVKSFSGDTKPTTGAGGSHPPRFNCYCFSCYTSYWVRWDGSVNRQLIHEIIDAYEDGLINNNNNNNHNNSNKKNGKNKKDRKKNKVSTAPNSPHAPPCVVEEVSHAPPQVEENMVKNDDDEGDGDGQDGLIVATSSEKGSVRKFVSFIGERIWGVWGI